MGCCGVLKSWGMDSQILAATMDLLSKMLVFDPTKRQQSMAQVLNDSALLGFYSTTMSMMDRAIKLPASITASTMNLFIYFVIATVGTETINGHSVQMISAGVSTASVLPGVAPVIPAIQPMAEIPVGIFTLPAVSEAMRIAVVVFQLESERHLIL
ncbi:hypothetical protein PsorP6_000495 [Peronosclerospora sorghi]|uniref:Uncharacterized protein n=1 Tax=Peronosclerospora sorghi TaxID=230839 RepID=A0ACC0WRW3_9STRA|nr:hypothetical protein PsorP6_000495 [Peronosclerospora sorghi]